MDSRDRDEQFESYLREFEPRRPQGLPAAIEASFEWRRIAAAATVLVVAGGCTWFAVHPRPSYSRQSAAAKAGSDANAEFTVERLSILSLTQTALEDPARLDTALTEQSRRVLPDFRGKESTLRVLAKE